ncbi:MAG TPA: hypothetical protein VLK26_00705 [Rudaea sp.]|nr:hypothetical protein [Rudaea sp.]
MLNRLRFSCLLLLALAPLAPLYADILVGSFTGNVSIHEVLRSFADNANGNVAPLHQLSGPANMFIEPVAGFYEPVENVIYVADFRGQAIRVFANGAKDDAAPIRVLDSAYVGQAKSVAVDTAHNELFTFASGCCLAAFDRTASGSAFYKRSVQWGGLSGSVTQQNSPSALVYMAPTDEVAEIDADSATPYAPKLLVFNRTDSGNTAPKRILKGTNTQFGNSAGGLAYDAAARRLYVGAYTTNVDLSHSARVLVFDDLADGNVAPLRSIAGAATGLELSATSNIGGLAIDPEHQHLIVSVSDYNAAAGNKLLVFALGASGNTAPLQTIAGALTGLPKSIGAPIWVPDRIFGNGFEGAP